LTAHLETETLSARAALWDNLPMLRDRLLEQGIRIEQFEIDLPQSQNQRESADPQQDRQSGDSGENLLRQSEADDDAAEEDRQAAISDGQIDVVA
jgi:flagellar hook-length control protein FliK